MKRILLLLMSVSVLITSCDLFGNHGKKVKFDENEVYYKGEGVTEDDAKNLGEYLKDLEYFAGKNKKSVQVTKDGNKYVVRFVLDEEIYNENKEQFALNFWYWQDLISENVFDGKETSIVLADEKMKDFETIDKLTKVEIGKGNYVYYKGKGVSEDDAEEIGKKLDKEKFFEFTEEAKFLLTKEKGEYAIRFLANDKLVKENKTEYYRILQNLQYIFSKYTLEEDLKLIVINNAFEDVKDFEEPSEAEKTRMDIAMKGETDQADPNQYTNNQQQTQPVDGDDIEGGNN